MKPVTIAPDIITARIGFAVVGIDISASSIVRTVVETGFAIACFAAVVVAFFARIVGRLGVAGLLVPALCRIALTGIALNGMTLIGMTR